MHARVRAYVLLFISFLLFVVVVIVLFNFFCNKSFDFSQPRLTCLPDVSHSSKTS